jgi:hypothetical protein
LRLHSELSRGFSQSDPVSHGMAGKMMQRSRAVGKSRNGSRFAYEHDRFSDDTDLFSGKCHLGALRLLLLVMR